MLKIATDIGVNELNSRLRNRDLRFRGRNFDGIPRAVMSMPPERHWREIQEPRHQIESTLGQSVEVVTGKVGTKTRGLGYVLLRSRSSVTDPRRDHNILRYDNVHRSQGAYVLIVGENGAERPNQTITKRFVEKKIEPNISVEDISQIKMSPEAIQSEDNYQAYKNDTKELEEFANIHGIAYAVYVDGKRVGEIQSDYEVVSKIAYEVLRQNPNSDVSIQEHPSDEFVEFTGITLEEERENVTHA